MSGGVMAGVWHGKGGVKRENEEEAEKGGAERRPPGKTGTGRGRKKKAPSGDGAMGAAPVRGAAHRGGRG